MFWSRVWPVTAPLPTESMASRASLARDFRRLGLNAGDTVLVHASLRSLGWVCGGATGVVLALTDVLGREGCLIVPAQTPDNRDPSRWENPRVPESMWDEIRDHILPFDPKRSPALAMGLIAEQVRTWPGAIRSRHPQTSFAGIGPAAEKLLATHELSCQLGHESPLGALYRADARFLLLGVGFDRCTAFHLAEYNLPGQVTRTNRCVVRKRGQRRWVEYQDIDLNAGDFAALGNDFENDRSVSVGTVGSATARLASVRDAVSYAEGWFMKNRHRTPS
ncbi:AAC(3) family N-acetyltransferase [Rhizocola hellebori]|uniref:Aminoglycoside N(3)-acetyltransferase n=1 Tax=Rhizocola hellebori TaxID=1392758 RepID=A0A8J3QD39_9ACTN|nr:AAC(3) family N-acetyltransferase [Rhizocola hellebori]